MLVQIPFDDYNTGSSSDHHPDDDDEGDGGDEDDGGHDSSHGSATERTLYLKIFNALIGVSMLVGVYSCFAPFQWCMRKGNKRTHWRGGGCSTISQVLLSGGIWVICLVRIYFVRMEIEIYMENRERQLREIREEEERQRVSAARLEEGTAARAASLTL